MECQRQVVKCGLAHCVIKHLHVVVDGLLVGQVEIIFHVVGRAHTMTRYVLVFGRLICALSLSVWR